MKGSMIVEKESTKSRILEVALELFSVQGYEATSISQIADAIGIRKASLYSHYASKKDILDTLVTEVKTEFDQHSLFAKADWTDPAFIADKIGMTPEMISAMVKGQIRYVIHDPKISRIRKMLTIEQFRNEELAALQSKQSYGDVLRYNIGLMRFLIDQGILIDEDPEIMAAQFAWPVTVWTNLCDREPEREPEAMELLDRHIKQFFKVYGRK